MIKIREAIVVEGKYDKNTLSQIIDAPILQTDGFHIMNDKAQLTLLRAIAAKRGLIIFTDSDGAGFVIRNHLKGAIPAQYIKHAYIPDIPGKERRKAAPGKEGKLGVEGMAPDVIVECLRRAGATIENQPYPQPKSALTKQDMVLLGLSGRPDSKAKRLELQKKLSLPAHMSSNALLQALNLLHSKEEICRLVEQL